MPSEQTQVKWTSFSGTEAPCLLPLEVPNHLDVMTKGRCSNRATFNRNHWLYRVLAYFYGNWWLRACKSFHQRVVCEAIPGQGVYHCQLVD